MGAIRYVEDNAAHFLVEWTENSIGQMYGNHLAGFSIQLVLAEGFQRCFFQLFKIFKNCPGTWLGTGIPVEIGISDAEEDEEKGNGEYDGQHYVPVHGFFP